MVVDKGIPMVCCGTRMELLVGNTVDASTEKHVPVVTRDGNVVTVSVGSVVHPNSPEHHISFIALHTNKGVQYKTPKIGEDPIAVFHVQSDEQIADVYEYCNLHGLWKS